jgi:hypothetical protein
MQTEPLRLHAPVNGLPAFCWEVERAIRKLLARLRAQFWQLSDA